MPPLFLRRRLREGWLKRDVAPLDGLGVGPGDLPRRRRVRPRAGRGIGPEVVVGRQALEQNRVGLARRAVAEQASQPLGKNFSVRPKFAIAAKFKIDRNAPLAHVYTRKRRSELRARCWAKKS